MKDLQILILIPIWWFSLFFIVGFVFADPFVSGDPDVFNATQLNADNYNFTPNQAYTNTTGFTSVPNKSGFALLDSLKFLFGFTMPSHADMPGALAVIFSFVNWLLGIIGLIVLFRQVRSGAG